jgi:transposase
MRTEVTKDSFKGQSFYVGIDYHKKSWKVTILGEQYEHKTMSQDPDPEQLAAYLKRNFPGASYHAVYEAGFSGFASCRRLNELGVKCMVIHPADVPTSQKEKLQKTDKADSRKLARSLRSQEFKPVHIPEQQLEADRALLRQRFRLVKDIARIKNRVKSLLWQFNILVPDPFTASQSRHWSGAYIRWLKEIETEQVSLRQVLDNYLSIGQSLRKELLLVNRQVRALAQSAQYSQKCNLLLSVPGIGITTAMSLLLQIGDINRFERLDEMCNYIGLVPAMYGSGDKMQTGKMIRRGRKDLKILLIEASWEAIRKDPALMLKYNELSKKMHGNKAIVRIARKMLSRVRFVLQSGQPYKLSIVK